MKGNIVELYDKVRVTENFEAHPSWIGREGIIHEIELGRSMWDYVLMLDATDDEDAATLAVNSHEIELINE